MIVKFVIMVSMLHTRQNICTTCTKTMAGIHKGWHTVASNSTTPAVWHTVQGQSNHRIKCTKTSLCHSVASMAVGETKFVAKG